jgi:hypothetical protein
VIDAAPGWYCASHSRCFWGLRLYLLCAPDGMPVSFCLAPANDPEHEVAAALLERARELGLLCGGEIIVGDQGFAGHEFERTVADLDATFLVPTATSSRGSGTLGAIRQWIESINDTLKGQLSLEDHGATCPPPSGTAGRSGNTDSSTRPAATSSTTTTDPAKTESVI